MRGDIIGALSDSEAERLMKLTYNYYLDESKYELVTQFNHDPSIFDFQKHIDSCLVFHPIDI